MNKGSLKQNIEKFKSFFFASRNNLYFILFLVLFGLLSFGLGFLSRTIGNQTPIIVNSPKLFLASSSAAGFVYGEKDLSEKGLYLASRNGSKFYLPWCDGVSRIKDENKIWFTTKEEAERRGFSPAANCNGL